MRPRKRMPVCRRRGADRGRLGTLSGEPAVMRLVESASSGRTAKAVGRLHSVPSNRVDMEQVGQPSPVSERSVVLLGIPQAHVGDTNGRPYRPRSRRKGGDVAAPFNKGSLRENKIVRVTSVARRGVRAV